MKTRKAARYPLNSMTLVISITPRLLIAPSHATTIFLPDRRSMTIRRRYEDATATRQRHPSDVTKLKSPMLSPEPQMGSAAPQITIRAHERAAPSPRHPTPPTFYRCDGLDRLAHAT